MDYLRRCGHNDFVVEVPGRNPIFLMIVTRREGSSLWACPGSSQFLYYSPVMQKTLKSTLYIVEISIQPLLMAVGHRYLQQ